MSGHQGMTTCRGVLRLAALARRGAGTQFGGVATSAAGLTAGASPDLSTHERVSSHARASCSSPGVGELHGARFGRRWYSEDLRIVHSELSEQQYHRQADACLDLLSERLEAFVEDLDVEDGDVEYSQGVLTVRLGEHGTYVINKQTPNQQIWMSSPVSGPFRYDYHEGRWVYHRDGRDLQQQLAQEIGGLLGQAPSLEAGG